MRISFQGSPLFKEVLYLIIKKRLYLLAQLSTDLEIIHTIIM